MGDIELQQCPSCHHTSLMLNNKNDRYECLNLKCRETFYKILVDRYNNLTAEAQKELEDIDKRNVRPWFRNQYYDPKKKKWRSV